MFGVLKKGKKGRGKKGEGRKKGLRRNVGQSGGVSPTCLPPAFPSPPHPYTTPCPLSSSVFSLVPFLFLSLSLCVLSGCGVWFVPRVCHTPPTHSLCLVLAAPPFLPLASTSLSVLSSSSSSSCCCGFVWVLLFVTPPLCFLACLWCVVVLVPRPPSFCPTSPCPFCPCPPLSSCCWWWWCG